MKRDIKEKDVAYMSIKDTLAEIVKKCVIENIKKLIKNGSLQIDSLQTYFYVEDNINLEVPVINFRTKKPMTIPKKYVITVEIEIDDGE